MPAGASGKPIIIPSAQPDIDDGTDVFVDIAGFMQSLPRSEKKTKRIFDNRFDDQK